ncbi:MAG: ATP-binding protein [Cyanobacteriota bacterium]
MQYTTQSAQIGQQITQIILTNPEPQTLLAKVAQALGAVFQVEACFIVALAKQGNQSSVNSVAIAQTALWRADDFPDLPLSVQAQLLEHPMFNADWRDSLPLAIRDLQVWDDQSTVGSFPDVLPMKALLKNHTWFQSSVNGIIVLGRSQPHDWTKSEQELLAIASDSVAVAISQVQLTRQVHSLACCQSLHHQLSLAMRGALDLDEILQLAITSTAQALQVSRSLLLLLTSPEPVSNNSLSEHLPKIEVKVAGEWSEELTSPSKEFPRLLNQSFWLSESYLCQQAFRDAPAPLLIWERDVAFKIDFQAETPSIFERDMMPALLIVPLLGTQSPESEVNVLGFLVLQHSQPRFWYADELELVEGVSAQISTAIIQNQTLQQVRSLVADRTAQLQHSLEVQAQLYEKTRQQIDQLQQLNQLKEEFMSTMSHELRTPLTTMSLAIRMLRQPKLPAERQDKYLKILEQECNKEIELINDLLSLQRLEADQASIQPQRIDLMSLIDQLVGSFEQKWADKRLTLTVESSVRSSRVSFSDRDRSLGVPVIKDSTPAALEEQAQSLMFNTDPDSLHRILLELLTNAGKYSDPDTTVCLQITHQIQPLVNQVVLTLSNIGSGISPDDLAHIFDKFRRGQGVTQQAVQGTGLGLALVKCLVQHLNGTIEVSSCPLDNSPRSITSFTVTLPQMQQASSVTQ